MFNNLINRYDLFRIAEKIKRGDAKKMFTKVLRGKGSKIEFSWQHVQAPSSFWYDIPAVKKRWNCLISGDKDVDLRYYVASKYLHGRENLCTMSLGCGTGGKEIQWARLGVFERIDAYDLSEKRIRDAAHRASEDGLDEVVKFFVADVHNIEVPDKHYDVIIAEHALHHFPHLNKVMNEVKRWLKPSGYFIVNDFVGPSRMQYTERQLEVVNGLLSILPKRYRRNWKTGTIKDRCYRPRRLIMMLNDPSEGIESQDILPLLHREFDILELKPYGGTVLNLLFADIAHNFMAQDTETQRLLNLCFEVEDALLETGELQSDFVFAICRTTA